MGRTVYGSPLHAAQTDTGTDSFMGLEVHYITAPSAATCYNHTVTTTVT
jgi:hypothetical protein